MSRGKLLSLQLLVAVVSVALWHGLTTVPIFGAPILPTFFFATPENVARRIVRWFYEGTIWRHLWITLVESVLAFLIGSIAGVLVGFWFGRKPLIAAVFDPYVKMINALPRIVLAPIFALWLGLIPMILTAPGKPSRKRSIPAFTFSFRLKIFTCSIS